MIELLNAEGYLNVREVPGRGYCGLMRFMFTTGLIWGLSESGYRGRWCYATQEEAGAAFAEWDGVGDPPGRWIKYKGEGGERGQSPQEDINIME